jgi:hypothetical protein
MSEALRNEYYDLARLVDRCKNEDEINAITFSKQE